MGSTLANPFFLRRPEGPSRRIEACPERVEGGGAEFDSPGEYVAMLVNRTTLHQTMEPSVIALAELLW